MKKVRNAVCPQCSGTGNVSGFRSGIIKIYAPVQYIRLEMDNAIKGILILPSNSGHAAK